MGKRNGSEVGHQQNYGPATKRTRFSNNTTNGHHHVNNDNESASSDEESNSSSASSSSSSTTSSKESQSPKPEFQLSRDIVNGTILTDLTEKNWRIGKPIGKGSFGEIFLTSDNISSPVTNENAKYVVKIEPHSNGPLFVEIHCLLSTAKNTDEEPLPPGMPQYIASGSHYFKDTRYRFLILPRFDRDLHSIIKHRRVDPKSILILAVQIIDVLQHLHDKGYCHSDIKAENLMISKCTFHKNQITNKDSSIWREEKNNIEADEEDMDDEDPVSDDNDADYGYRTPQSSTKKTYVQYSGSNPVRSCRVKKRNSIYQEMLKSHYLRPSKKINYSEFFSDENSKSGDEDYTLDEYISRQRLSGRHEPSRSYDREKLVTEDRIFLIDFGLASKFVDANGVHRPFCMDQRRAHDGTLQFTSRDAHMGAHSRRSDLECLGYNLIYWSQGYLPWKENAAQQQHEKVHWMKEYLMKDVTEMLKHIYGKTVPKYLGEFMHYVGHLAYDQRPDYKKCRGIFIREFMKMGYKEEDMFLNVAELSKKVTDLKDEIENNNIFEMKNLKSIMKNLGVFLPFRESNSNRVSPKNLRSKSDKEPNKKRKKFSWAEILSQDPDQIARERAEKEFEREQTTETPLIRYSGKPTYAILEIENRIKFKDRLDAECETEDEEFIIKGYTKPMMEIIKKRQASLLADAEKKHQNQQANDHQQQQRQSSNKTVTRLSKLRAKPGLRTVITPTKRGLDYSHEMGQRRGKRSHKNSGDFTTDESSCSSLNSVASSTVANSKKSQFSNNSTSISMRGGSSTASQSGSVSTSTGGSDVEEDILMVFSPKRTRNSAAKIMEIDRSNVNKRKKTIPRKRNAKGLNECIVKINKLNWTGGNFIRMRRKFSRNKIIFT